MNLEIKQDLELVVHKLDQCFKQSNLFNIHKVNTLHNNLYECSVNSGCDFSIIISIFKENNKIYYGLVKWLIGLNTQMYQHDKQRNECNISIDEHPYVLINLLEITNANANEIYKDITNILNELIHKVGCILTVNESFMIYNNSLMCCVNDNVTKRCIIQCTNELILYKDNKEYHYDFDHIDEMLLRL